MDVSLNGLSKEMHKNLIEEIRQLEQDIKTSEFISPKKMREIADGLQSDKNNKMKKQPFLTEAFYRDDTLTLDVFNFLLKNQFVADKDNYRSGAFLYLSIVDNEKSRDKLSEVISDFDAYIEYSNSRFEIQDKHCIDLSVLHEVHCRCFSNFDEIIFDQKNQEYIQKGTIYNIF